MAEYTCDHCHGTFQYVDEWDADAEVERVWKDVPRGDDRAELCDDCYHEFMAWMRETHPEALKEPAEAGSRTTDKQDGYPSPASQRSSRA